MPKQQHKPGSTGNPERLDRAGRHRRPGLPDRHPHFGRQGRHRKASARAGAAPVGAPAR
jgi:hypothetical protein